MIRTSDTTGAAWSSDIERTRGYHDALAEAGIAPREGYVVTRPFGVHAGGEGMALLLTLPEPPTAVFAYSDEIAFSAWTHLTANGMRVPEDMSLVGVDGHPLSELVGLTTVTQSVHAQGRLAGEMALALLQGEVLDDASVVVPSVLVIRRSTARHREADRHGS